MLDVHRGSQKHTSPPSMYTLLGHQADSRNASWPVMLLRALPGACHSSCVEYRLRLCDRAGNGLKVPVDGTDFRTEMCRVGQSLLDAKM